MSTTTWVQFVALIVALGVFAPLLGRYMAGVYGDGRTSGDRIFLPLERLIYRACRVDDRREQRWTVYAYSVLGFSLVSFLAVSVLQRLQGSLPFNPSDVSGVVPHLSFNTAVSFMTNTNWQSYGGESTMSHLTQMTGLAVQNFVSAAAGMAVMAALIRGIARRRAKTLGNFWVDLTRSIVRILLPLSLVVAVLLVSQGVIQNFHGHTDVTTLEGTTQVIAGGPAASQIAIKQLGTNGGGFFNVNSAHPFENSTPFNNFIETFSIAIIPFALAFTFGHMVRDRRQGRAVFAIMVAIWGLMSIGAMALEGNGNPNLDALGADQSVSAELAGGGNLEGKEVRFGTGASGLWAATTTGTSNGSVNAMHDSMTPLGGGIAMTHMMLGEVSPGGVGVGLNGLLIMAILAVFLAGLMVGRTPEYLGKKIQAVDMKMVVLYLLAMPVALLGFAAASVVLDSAQTTNNPGPHGLTEILYAFTSAANNNGSAFAGLTTATQWYDTTLGIAMLVGRFFLIIPVLGIAGSLARKQTVPASAGTFPTHTPLFAGLVVGVVVIVAGLTFFPALALGPIVEQLSL
ncbi:MAG TPA: potassium-transporting ATPase subunit KdpA [Desertimonas sp.]|nr:potassium-transporting ATPase subunit KdpA [Desertimonas sp.]